MPAEVLEETRAGNYFVSNYPPFSCWTPDGVKDALSALCRSPAVETSPVASGPHPRRVELRAPLGIYLHIPFCRKRCHFCYFKVYTDKNAADIESYVDAALAELALYAQTPLVRGRKPSFVYFGGGTPSYLSARQLERLTARMKALLPWEGASEVTFEAEPGTLAEGKLVALRDMGVTRLSLGIENFDDRILEVNGRAHRSKEIESIYAVATRVGFPQINVDLISGMVGETDENWRDVVAKTIAFSPDSVTIYQMEVPHNTTIFKEMKAAGSDVAPVASWAIKRLWMGYAFAELERAGYTVASAYTAVKDPKRTHFVYRDRLWAGADLLPLGVSSFGHLGGTHLQNLADFDAYLAPLAQGRLPLWRALTPTADERLIREFVLQLKLGRLQLEYFRDKFGVDARERFAQPLSDLSARGLATVGTAEVRLTREALLQVDGFLHTFFLPQHQNIRYT